MICNKTVEKYCNGDISQIENYDKAVTDMVHTWACHHRAEILPCGNFSLETLKKYGLYYKRHASELIFLTKSEHQRLHHSGKTHHLYGKHHSDETRIKMSLAHKGKHHSDETRRKISEANQNISEETRRKISEALKGKKKPPMSEEQKKKLSEANKGKTISSETKLKMSAKKKGDKNSFFGKHHSEETRRKISEAIKSYYSKKKMVGK